MKIRSHARGVNKRFTCHTGTQYDTVCTYYDFGGLNRVHCHAVDNVLINIIQR